MVTDNILGFELGQDIGEGGQARYGKLISVRLGYNPTSGLYVAIKVLQKRSKHGQLLDINLAKKEYKIHNSVSHQNIIKLFGTHEDQECVYLIMEYAAAGELFDKIEPDVGIDEEIAHFFFHQLISAMSYLHSVGICHRDLKPEVNYVNAEYLIR
jgi:serine/threonine-protein kinase CHEK1